MAHDPRPPFDLRALAQLLRIPNVFTALADVGLAWLAAGGLAAGAWDRLALLGLVSACLYLAGMVWNDFFDLEEDRRDRPFRPLPSGRIAVRTALLLALGLLLAGVLVPVPGGPPFDVTEPFFLLRLALAAAILVYDGWAKRTPLGPLFMGLCRFLNVLLACAGTVRPEAVPGLAWHLAGVVGVYIVGVTWFARTEATRSRRGQLLGAVAVMAAAAAGALEVPLWRAPTDALEVTLFPYLLAGWAAVVGRPLAAALRDPGPKQVQTAVKTCILGLVGLDAVLAFALVGWPGLAILLLLPPALVLGRWVYST